MEWAKDLVQELVGPVNTSDDLEDSPAAEIRAVLGSLANCEVAMLRYWPLRERWVWIIPFTRDCSNPLEDNGCAALMSKLMDEAKPGRDKISPAIFYAEHCENGSIHYCGLLYRMNPENLFAFITRKISAHSADCSGDTRPSASSLLHPEHFLKTQEGLLRTLCHLTCLVENSPKTGSQSSDANSSVSARAIRYICDHLEDTPSREQVAKAVGLSPSRFSSVLMEQTGKTYTSMLNEIRVRKMKTMLWGSEMGIAEAVFSSGFQSLSQGYRVFGMFTGMTPKQFRRGARIDSGPSNQSKEDARRNTTGND